MKEPESPGPPTWVYKRDGRLVPFEADKITQALFAASEQLGRPDAFLARELTDGALHFLGQEIGQETPTTAQLADLVTKIVRELGQPALAQAYLEQMEGLRPDSNGERSEKKRHSRLNLSLSADETPAKIVQQCLQEYSLNVVFSRDLAAAQREGLLTLTGLEAPEALAGGLLPWPDFPQTGFLEKLLGFRQQAGLTMVLDSPEWTSARHHPQTFCTELAAGLKATGLAVRINLHCSSAPPWAVKTTQGPLFAGKPAEEREVPGSDDSLDFLKALMDHPTLKEEIRIEWHLGPKDFQEEAFTTKKLISLARLSLENPRWTFTFDRPRQEVLLAEGVDRRHSAILMTVGLHLPRLLEWPGVRGDLARYLGKLTCLGRMAVSAGIQKRKFLRRKESMGRQFLLDRARLVVTPVGLEAVVQSLTGQGFGESRTSLEIGRKILFNLVETLRRDGATAGLEICLDGPDQGFSFLSSRIGDESGSVPTLAQVAGLTCWSPSLSYQEQVRTTGWLQAGLNRGKAAVLVSASNLPTPEELAALLSFAWKRTGLVRLQLVRCTTEKQTRLDLAIES